MSDEHKKYNNFLKSSEEVIMNVPKICLLPQSSFNEYENQLLSGVSVSKLSNRDSGNFDTLFTGSKVNLNYQIKTVHNWFKHLPGCDQARLVSTLLPSVHFDYMAMIASLAQKQAKYIAKEVFDYQNLEEESNNLQSLSSLEEEPSLLAVNLLARLPLLLPCDIATDHLTTARIASVGVHKLYATLLTQVFNQEFSDVEEMLAVKQLATVTAHHPNLLPQLQNNLIELAIERLLLDERTAVKRPRRPGALSPFDPPGQMTQTQSFSLLVPPFLAASCLSASASPQSVCSYNSSGFHSGAESANRRHHPPLSPQSSESSCAGDDSSLLPHSVSCDYDIVGLPSYPDGGSLCHGEGRAGSLQGQSSIDTPTPSSASSVMLLTKQLSINSPNSGPLDPLKSPTNLLKNLNEFNFSCCQDDELDSETNYPITREPTDGGRNSFTEPGSGMSYVPSWLKSLRLHKYADLFQQLNYNEMLTITDEWLESKNVTKGARNKILVNVRKLESRQSILRAIESDLISSGSMASLRACLYEIRYILTTPIRPFSDEISGYVVTAASGVDSPPHSVNGNVAQGDLPGQIVRCLSRVCSQLLVCKKVEEENYSLFVHIIDSILEHESFTGRHKNLCKSWYSQLQGNRELPRKGSCLWAEPQTSSYHKLCRQQSSLQPDLHINTHHCSTLCPPPEQYCPLSSVNISLPTLPHKDMPPVHPPPPPHILPRFQLPMLSAMQQHYPQVMDTIDRTLLATNQSALLNLFLQCQSFPTTSVDSSYGNSSSIVNSIPLDALVPSWLPSGDSASINPSESIQSQFGSDCSPNGSQDPTTAEINRNLDLLAREVTEKAIRDPESPDA